MYKNHEKKQGMEKNTLVPSYMNCRSLFVLASEQYIPDGSHIHVFFSFLFHPLLCFCSFLDIIPESK